MYTTVHTASDHHHHHWPLYLSICYIELCVGGSSLFAAAIILNINIIVDSPLWRSKSETDEWIKPSDSETDL